METKRTHETVLEDSLLIAYLSLKPSLIITPQRMPNGRVSFTVSGKGIQDAIAELYSNAPVGVNDYIRAVKRVKSTIFNLKGNGNGKDHS